MPGVKRIIIDLTKQQGEEIERLIREGVYRTKAEAIRDAVRLLIETRRDKELQRRMG